MRIAVALMAFAGALAWSLKESLTGASHTIGELKRSVEALRVQVSDQTSVNEARFQRVESRLDEYECRLNALPTAAQILAPVQELLTSLDQRMLTHEHSVDALQQAVGRTDRLIGQVLDSITALTGQRKSAA